MSKYSFLFIGALVGYLAAYLVHSPDTSNNVPELTSRKIQTSEVLVSKPQYPSTEKKDEVVERVQSKIAQEEEEDRVQIVEKIRETTKIFAETESLDVTDLAAMSLSPSVEKAYDIIEKVNESELRNLISSMTQIEPRDLEAISDVKLFSKRLVETALLEKKPSQQSSPDQQEIVEVVFSTEVDGQNQPVDPKSAFENNVQRIYASFSFGDTPTTERVFVKWYLQSPYKIKLFNKYSISRTSVHNFIWLRPPSWLPGQYSVELYTLEDNLKLVGSGDYVINP